MASADSSGGVIETTGYLGCNNSRLSRLELIQQQQHNQYHLSGSQSQPCEHNCICVHNHHPLINHPQQTRTNTQVPLPFNPHHHHHPTTQQHIHPHSHYHQTQHTRDSNLIYNNSSTNSECNQATNDSSQSGCSNVHYIPTSNLSVTSQNLNIPNLACDCGSNCQAQHGIQIHHPRQQSMEQQSLQSGRSSRIVSCDENNPSGTEDGSGMSSSGMMGGRRASKRNL